MAGFGLAILKADGSKWPGFGSRKYRPTVSRLIPNSFAMRRCDHPRWGQAVHRCLQAHFEDIRHAPLNRFLLGTAELYCFP